MTQPVHFDDLDKDDYGYYYAGVYYEGQPFTGIAYENDGQYVSEYQYLNGMAHGKWKTTHSSGQKIEEIEFFEGKEINEEFEWYTNGQIKSYKSHNPPRISRNWDERGLLIFERLEAEDIEKEWYPAGELKYVQQSKIRTYFTKGGNWVLKVELPLKATYYADIEYHDEVIENEYGEIFSDKDLAHYSWGWIHTNFESKRTRVVKLLCRLAEHEDLGTKCIAIFVIGDQKVYEAAPILKAALSDHRIMLDHYGYGQTRPISHLAKEALIKLSVSGL